MAKGIQRRELKEPDEFLTLTRRYLAYAQHHERQVTLAALGVIALIAVALGVRWYRSWQESNAEAAFGAARLDYAAQKFDAAAQSFQKVGTTWPRTAYGQLALVYVGNCYPELGKTKEAGEAFTPARPGGRGRSYRPIAHS